MTLPYQLVILDFDGTLADSLSWFIAIANEIADHFQMKRIDPADHELLRGYDARQILAYLKLPLWKAVQIGAHLKQRMAREIQQLSLFPGVDEFLRDAEQAGVTLALVSSNTSENIQGILGVENMARIHYFACGVSIFGKPVKLRRILRESGQPAGAAIYVGDEIRDVQAARQVEMASGAVSWGYNTAKSLQAQSPTYLFGSLDEMRRLLTGQD